ncbi:hypothetical protein KAF25_010841 [Fusarium avenaceum]|uniref:Uncharacterized protein n=1 Tax=Fusarium avenaceum TaxID=40199 RepID=A0A9P7H443_9HYPO|nr:hypothetical protein KAF25_010841 [Fusarium avenaceum]
MMILWHLLAFLSTCTATLCRLPNQNDYTIIQDPFLGDIDHGQPGIVLRTLYDDGHLRWFMVYQNGIDFKPYRAMNIPSNATVFVDLTTSCSTFAGRLIRGNNINFNGMAHNLGTWAEVNWGSYPSAYGGVSVIEGNDGPILFQSEDPNTPIMGFSNDIITAAPNECREVKDSGALALKPTDKNGYDEKTHNFTEKMLDSNKVSIDNTHDATTMSHNGRLRIMFLQGNH